MAIMVSSLSGMGNAFITDDPIRFVRDSRVPPVVHTAKLAEENGVSINQYSKATGVSEADIRAALMQAGFERSTPSTPLAIEPSDLAENFFVQPGNGSISAAEIKDTIEQIEGFAPNPDLAAHTILLQAMNYRVNARQIVEAMVGVPGFSQEEVEAYLLSQGVVSPRLWGKVVEQSLIPEIRAGLTDGGLDGSGVTVQVLEIDDESHGEEVRSVIGDSVFGIAPGAEIEKAFLYPTDEAVNEAPPLPLEQRFWEAVGRSGLPPDDPRALKAGLSSLMATLIEESLPVTTQKIDQFVEGSDARVLNMSYGIFVVSLYQEAMGLVTLVPELHKAMFPELVGLGQVGEFQRIVDLVDESVFNDAGVIAVYNEYVDATRRAAADGKVIVVSAGNSQRQVNGAANAGVRQPAGAGFNVLAMSDFVISVGASTTHGTPENLADDTIASFSSQGNDRFHATVTTQGVAVPIPYDTDPTWGTAVDGTSFSAPIVSGTVALILQRHPDLTFAQVKAVLEGATVDTAAPSIAEGAGMLDVVGAARG